MPSDLRQSMPEALRAYLLKHIYSWRVLRAGYLIGIALALALAWLLFTALLDRFFAFGPGLRGCFLFIDILFLVAVLAHLAWQLSRPPDFHRAAATIEPNFDQRLETLVSQWVAPSRQQISDPIVAQLWMQVQGDLTKHPPASLIPWKRLTFPWLSVAIVIFLGVIFCLIPTLGFPRLALRFMRPYAAIPPVTTTQLTVDPGTTTIAEQTPLTIHVIGKRLGPIPPTIHYSSDSLSYAQALMSPGENAFVWTIPVVQKDFCYFITGGDARTPLYTVTLLHSPSVSQLQVRYQYPTYTHHDPLTVTTAAGPIQAPAGTRVGIDVISLTPLANATLQMGSEKITANATGFSTIRHFDLILNHDVSGRLHLVGANGQPCKQDLAIQLSAIPDQPPLVRQLQPAADMHLTPRDLLTIAWQALDDYGVEKLFLQLQINSDPPRQIPLPISGDRRRCVGIVDLDLANMPLKIGDVLSTALIAQDGAGHQTPTAQRRILISPRSVDIDTYLRLSALRQSADLAGELAQNLQSAVSQNQVYQNLAAASDACSLLRQSLLAAIQHGANPGLSTALAHLCDDLAIVSATVEQSQTQIISERLVEAAASTANMQNELNVIARGQQAAIVLADRANVREMSTTIQADPQLRLRIEQTLSRAADEAAAGATALGIAPTSADADSQLTARVKAGDQMVASIAPIDLLAASKDWEKQMADPIRARRDFAGRMEMAADVEGVRINGQAVRARDLLLAGRAAHRIEETALHDSIINRQVLAKMIADYPVALSEMFGQGGKAENVATARAQMKLWAAEPELLASATDVLEHPEAQDLAMEANARMAQHDYSGAAALDVQLANTPEAQQARQNIIAAARQMRSAERVDRVGLQQQAVAQQTQAEQHSAGLARSQEQVVQGIEQVRKQSDSPLVAPLNSRDQAMGVVLAAREKLTGVAGVLSDSHQREGGSPSPVVSAEAIATDLDRFNPETAAAVQAIREELIPTLNRWSDAAKKGNRGDVAAAATSARNTIAHIQGALSQIQQRFAEEDPLVAAKWFAQAAASALSRQPPDFSAARQQQSNVTHALQNAWTEMIRQAALQRLAGSAEISSPLAGAAPAQAWQPVAPPSGLPSSSEPAGYDDALRAYFQALSQEQGSGE